jgi:hypothetical protein
MCAVIVPVMLLVYGPDIPLFCLLTFAGPHETKHQGYEKWTFSISKKASVLKGVSVMTFFEENSEME